MSYLLRVRLRTAYKKFHWSYVSNLSGAGETYTDVRRDARRWGTGDKARQWVAHRFVGFEEGVDFKVVRD